MKHGFTLIELLVVLAIIALLAVIAIPAGQRVQQKSRSAACLGHLGQLGTALSLYLGEHDMTMPALAAGRRDKTEELPVIDNTLDTYIKEPATFACPADANGLAAKTGTSYFWNVALNGQALASLSFLMIEDQSHIPILADKEGWHPDQDRKVNVLYADGHVTTDLSFSTGK